MARANKICIVIPIISQGVWKEPPDIFAGFCAFKWYTDYSNLDWFDKCVRTFVVCEIWEKISLDTAVLHWAIDTFFIVKRLQTHCVMRT